MSKIKNRDKRKKQTQRKRNVELARQMAEELAEGHDDVDFDNSYIRISA